MMVNVLEAYMTEERGVGSSLTHFLLAAPLSTVLAAFLVCFAGCMDASREDAGGGVGGDGAGAVGRSHARQAVVMFADQQ
jgi:hypothetical protein